MATAPAGSILTGFHFPTCRCKATKDHAFKEQGDTATNTRAKKSWRFTNMAREHTDGGQTS